MSIILEYMGLHLHYAQIKYTFHCRFMTDMIEEKTWTWEMLRTNQGGKESRLEF